MSLDRLYRGVNEAMHVRSHGRITPKNQGAFEHVFTFDGTITFDSSATFGPSEQNAVLWHQLADDRDPTSGISTTPSFARAVFYATWGGEPGVVYEIDRLALGHRGVREFIVAAYVAHPRVPEDDEVILVTPSGEPLPSDLVVHVSNVAA